MTSTIMNKLLLEQQKYQEALDSVNEAIELEKLKPEYKNEGKDTLTFEDTECGEKFTVECNYPSWHDVKCYENIYPFTIEISEDYSGIIELKTVELKLEDVKLLVQYLQEKIDFLEE